MKNLPAGLRDSNGEFFIDAHHEPCLLTGGRVIDFNHFPEEVIVAVREEMYSHPAMIYAYEQMGAVGEVALMKQFLICNWGGFDHVPDMIAGELQEPEIWDCPERGTCAFEGIGCSHLKVKDSHISPRELQVIKLTAEGFLDKHIADKLNIKVSTVTTHSKNVRRKTGLFRKADITRFAHQQNLVS